MDVDGRLSVLNKRLDVVHDLYSVLNSELENDHGTRLELIVIWLIVIEVVLGLIEIFAHKAL